MKDPIYNVRRALERLGSRIEHDRGDGFMAQCPLHDDETPSLHVSTGDAGQAVFYCHAGCTETPTQRSALVEALDLIWSDLFGPSSGYGTGFFREREPDLDRLQPRAPARGAREQGRKDARRQGPEGTADVKTEPDEARALGEVEELLAMVAAGSIGVEVEPLPLPGDASEPMRRVAAFFERVLAVRRWADMPAWDEVPFAIRWAAKHVGLPDRTAGNAIRRLREAGSLVFVREMERRGGMPRGNARPPGGRRAAASSAPLG